MAISPLPAVADDDQADDDDVAAYLAERARLADYLRRTVDAGDHADEARLALFHGGDHHAGDGALVHAMLAVLAEVERVAVAVERVADAVEGLQ
jgi:hypothetical protein